MMIHIFKYKSLQEMMVQAGDTGRDFEHCQSLQRKLDDVDSVSNYLCIYF